MNIQPKTAFDMRPSTISIKEMEQLVEKFSKMKIEDPDKEKIEKPEVVDTSLGDNLVQGFLFLDSIKTFSSLFC